MKKVSLFFVAMFVMISATVAQTSVWDGTHTSSINGTGTQFDYCPPVTNLQLSFIQGGYACKSASLTWDAAGGGTFSYTVYRDGIEIGIVSGTAFNDNNVGPGYHTWRIRTRCPPHELSEGVDIGGSWECEPVTNVEVSFQGDCTAIINWTGVGGVWGYRIYRNGSYIGEAYGTEYTDEYIVSGTYYVWTIKTVCCSGYGESEGVDVGGTSPECNPVTNAHVFFNNECTSATIGWTGTGALYYSIYRDGNYIGQTYDIYFVDENIHNMETYATWTIKSHCCAGVSNGVNVEGYCAPATIQTDDATNITQTSATLRGSFSAGSYTITDRGFEYKSATESTYTQVHITGNNSTYNLTGLTRATTYQFRAFLTSTEGGTIYGETKSFFTIPFYQEGNAFLIETKEDLILLANLVNNGWNGNNSGQEFMLTNHIILPNTPNNILSIGTKNHPFCGIFNGNNYHIYNVYIDNPNTENQGFFGCTQNAQIKDLGLIDITASGRNYTGGMVGYAGNTKLDDSFVSGGTLYALSYCGGLVGYQAPGTNSVITGCHNTCTVTGNNYVGGLLGYSNEGTVRNSYVAAAVSGQGDAVGAIIGGALNVLYYNCWYNSDYPCPDVEIGENIFKSGGRGGMTSADMRKPEFVTSLNQGLATPVWKMDYNPPINNGFPILIWQTAVNILEIATLSSLTVSAGILTPSFNKDILKYTVDVPINATSITIAATTTHPDATVTGVGVKQLSAGANPFTLTVTAADGKTTLNYMVTVNCIEVGIVENGLSNIKVYPNPTDGQLQVTGYELQGGDYHIFNIMGRLMMQGKLSDETTSINVESLASGMYFLRIAKKTVKFVKR